MTPARALSLAASLLLFACNKQAPAPTPTTAASATAAVVAVAPATAQADRAPVGAEDEVRDADPYAGAAEGVIELDPPTRPPR